MKTTFRRMLCIFLSVALIAGCGMTAFAAPGSSTPSGGTTVLSWDEFYSGGVKSGSATVTKCASGSGVAGYDKYLSFSIPAGEKNTSSMFKFIKSGQPDFSMATGDKILLHIIMRGSAVAAGQTAYLSTCCWDQKGNEKTSSKYGLMSYNIALTDGWTEYYIPYTASFTDTANTTLEHIPDQCNILFGTNATGSFSNAGIAENVDIACLEYINYGAAYTGTLPNGTFALGSGTPVTVVPTVEGDNVDFFGSIVGTATAVTDLEGFTSAKTLAASQAYDFSSVTAYTNGDMLLFSYVMKAVDACAKVTFTVDAATDTTMTYYIPAQWTRVYMPMQISSLKSVKLETEGNVRIAEAKFVNKHSASFADLSLLSGLHLLEDFEEIHLDASTYTGAGACKDLAKVGNYVYSIGDSKLSITDVSGDTATVVSTMSGLTENIRQISVTDDGKYAFITARECGVFVVDVQNPAAPFIATIYDSVEYGNGVEISGNYAFICNRQYGVEILDISNPLQPAHKSIVHCGEAQSCKLINGILYCGLWGECQVAMYDVTNPNSPRYLSVAKLSGKGDGMSVCELGGKTYLFAATGQHYRSLSSSTPLSNLEWGQGNGLDIFDVTDPENPVWQSTSQIDGRYYFVNHDYWDVEVSVSNGHIYAYMMNTYNGVFVYDATNPKAPVRLSQIDIVLNPAQKATTSLNRAIIFPYDQDVVTKSPVGAIEVEDGALYVAGALSDMHVYRSETASFYDTFVYAEAAEMTPSGTPYYHTDGGSLDNFSRVDVGSQAYTVAEYSGYLFVAAGAAGIKIYNKDLELQSTVRDVSDMAICYDVQIRNGKLYAAMGADGLVIYTISGSTLTRSGAFTKTSGSTHCRGVVVSATGKFALLQVGASSGQLVNLEKGTSIKTYAAGTQMYHRNLATLSGGRYLGMWGAGGKEFWFDCGADEASTTTPTLIAEYASGKTSVIWNGGATDYNGKVLSNTTGGYRVYTPGSGTAPTYDFSVSLGTNANGVSIFGRPTIYGNYLIMTDRAYGNIYVYDITNIKAPELLKWLPVNGNPDIAYVENGTVYIPMGYQGLVKFDLPEDESDTHEHCVCGGVAGASHTCTAVTYTAMSFSDAVQSELTPSDTTMVHFEGDTVNLCIPKGFSWDKTIEVYGGQTINICLNGQSITATKRLFKMYDGTVNFCDCKGTGKISNTAGSGSFAYVMATRSIGGTTTNVDTVINYYGGTFHVTGTSSRNYGPIYSNGHFTFNMYGGEMGFGDSTAKIVKNSSSAYGGGGVLELAKTDNHINIYGGKLKGCNVTTTGGVIDMQCTDGLASELNISGGVLTGGSSASNGALIYVSQGKVTITGGTFEGGTCLRGGVIYLNSAKANATVSGGTFDGGNATTGGSIFYCNGSSVTSISGGTFRATTGTHGGIFYVNNSTVDITGGTFTGNADTSIAYGGVFYQISGTVTMSGMTVTGGKAGVGGAYYISGGILNMNGGTVKNGVATTSGGNFYISGGTVNINGGTVLGGSAPCGGNFMLEDAASANTVTSTLTIGSATVKTGKATDATNGRGGNIYLADKDSTVILDGTTLYGGSSAYRGKNVAAFAGHLKLKGNVQMTDTKQDITVEYAKVAAAQLLEVDFTDLDTTEPVNIYNSVDGAFAKGTQAQTSMVAYGGSSTDTFEVICLDGYLYCSRPDSTLVMDATNTQVGAYHCVAEAVKHLTAGSYIQVAYPTMDYVTYEGESLYLDLNGNTVRGVYTLGTDTVLYGMNSATDNYDTDSALFYGLVSGGTVAGSCKAPNARRYLATGTEYTLAMEDGMGRKFTTDTTSAYYAFDRFYIGITHMSFYAGKMSAGYKAAVVGNTVIQSKLAAIDDEKLAFGVKLTVPELTDNALYFSAAATDFAAGKDGYWTCTCQINNILSTEFTEAQNKANAQAAIIANVYIKLGDEVITSADYTFTLKDMVMAADSAYAAMGTAQQAALRYMLSKWSAVMADWSFTNIGK